MRLLIIIPAHNEEKTIGLTLTSLQNQDYGEFQVCVVDDGSQDKTFSIAQAQACRDARFSVTQKPNSAHAPGSKVVQAFESGLKLFKLEDFEVICKFDADIVFPTDYLTEVVRAFQDESTAGLVGGLCFISGPTVEAEDPIALTDFTSHKGWAYENISAKTHVRGPIKAYRTSAFLAMGGLRPVLGWDNLDELLLRKAGFDIRTLPQVWVKHLRPTGSIYQKQQLAKLGAYFRNLGLDLPLAVAAAGKEAIRRKSLSAFFSLVRSYLVSPDLGHLSPSEVKFIRQYRYRQLLKKYL